MPDSSGRKSSARLLDSLVLTQAKVHMPSTRPPLVERTSLLDELVGSRDIPVVLISAPPGYGKTTLLGQWDSRDDRPFAYVRLEEADNDPVVMLAYITLALDALDPVEAEVKDALRAPAPALGREVLPSIANEMDEREPFVLVLDDIHELSDDACLRTVAYLSENMPPGSQLVLAGWTDPPIPLASLRVARRLLEIRADRLLLDAVEAGALLSALEVELAPDKVRQLVDQTEGWPAGLYLAALYLRGCDAPAACVGRFRGDRRDVADYFVTEVLARQPEDTVQFLRRTSILERLSGSLCDAVLGRQDSGEQLARIQRAVPFLAPVDEHHEWYRYHNQFAELLACELGSLEPGIVPDLHRRAAAWYESEGPLDRNGADSQPSEPAVDRRTLGFLESAIHHLAAAGELTHAGDVLARHWRPFAASGRLRSLRRLLDGFTAEQLGSHPPLALTGAWIAYLTGDGEDAMRLLEAAEPIERAQGSDWDEFRSSLALLRAGLGIDGLPRMRTEAEKAYALESEEPTSWFGLSRVTMGVVHLLEGDDDRAMALLLEAAQVERRYVDVRMLATGVEALCEVDTNEWDQARGHARDAYGLALNHSLVDYFPSALAQAVHARVLAHDGDGSNARRVIADALRVVEGTPRQSWPASLALLVIVDAQLDLGDTSGAEATLKEAGSAVRAGSSALAARHASAQAAVGLQLLSEPLSPSELHVFEQLPAGGSLTDIASSIYLSRNTVKSHVRSIYRKLGVSSREEAVDLGRRLGLLG